MIHFTFTVKLLKGNPKEWASHDVEISQIVSRHNGTGLKMKYADDGMARIVSVYYRTLDDIHNAATEIRMFFRKKGIHQTVPRMKQNRLTAKQSLKEIREALTC